jgi:signal transduction histidine kinase
VNAILDCLETHAPCQRECRIRSAVAGDGGAIEVEATASFIDFGELEAVVLVLRDIRHEKRRRVLEQTFFHDVLNVVFGLQAMVHLMGDPDEEPELREEYRRDLKRMVTQVADELRAHRQLSAAERGDLAPEPDDLAVDALLEQVAELYRFHGVALGKQLVVEPTPGLALRTDPVLLRRVLGNLVKNALEATAAGGTVTLGATTAGEQVTFRVANPGVMPPEVQMQLFQRSFTTKPGYGHGLGTHSVKLLTERYLHGQVAFTSTEPGGTVFSVTLPCRWPAATEG